VIEPFLRALFAHVPPGQIEVRSIEDRKGGASVLRAWHPSADALIERLSDLHKISATNRSGVFYGVLPRRAEGVGGSADTLPGRAIWADIDFKDLAGGEEEGRRLLAGFPHPPTAIVASGHGLHAYWFLKELAAPADLSDVVARVAQAVRGDRVSDAARILRLPGTTNWKNPEKPIVSVFEKMELEIVYDLATIRETVLMFPGATPSDGTPGPTIKLGAELSEKVQALLAKHARLANLFSGKGKTAIGEDGRRLDESGSGYDFSFTLSLARYGIHDPSELATALALRPDGGAKLKGSDYLSHTVGKVLQLIERTSKNGHAAIKMDRMVIYKADPPYFEATMQGVTFKLESKDISTPAAFRLRFLEAGHRMLPVPNKRDEWDGLVNAWMASAEIVDLPPEASAEETLRSKIREVIEGLTLSEEAVDLERGAAFWHEEYGKVFKTKGLMAVMERRKEPGATLRAVCSALDGLGYESALLRLHGDDPPTRIWRLEAPDGPVAAPTTSVAALPPSSASGGV